MGRLKSAKNIIGTYHYVGEVICSWAAFAEKIFNEAIKQGIIENKPKIIKISTSEFPTKAKRPLQSKLDFSKFKSIFRINQLNYPDNIHLAIADCEELKQKKRNYYYETN